LITCLKVNRELPLCIFRLLLVLFSFGICIGRIFNYLRYPLRFKLTSVGVWGVFLSALWPSLLPFLFSESCTEIAVTSLSSSLSSSVAATTSAHCVVTKGSDITYGKVKANPGK